MQRLAVHRGPDQGFSDLHGWAQLAASGLVWTRSGKLVAGFWSSPADASSKEDAERDAFSGRLNQAFGRLGTGWTLWSDVAVVPAGGYPPPETSHFPAEAARLIDAERRAQFQAEGAHFERDHALLFSYQPPAAAGGRLADALHRDEDERRSAFARANDAMRQELEKIEDHAGRGLRLRRMQSYLRDTLAGPQTHYDELVSYLAYTAFGKHFPLALPDDGAFLDTVIGGRDFYPGDFPLLGDERIACVAIDGFPARSVPGILDALSSLRTPYRFTQRFIFLDPHDAVAEIKKYRRQWAQQVVPFFRAVLGMKQGPVNAAALENVGEVDAALALANGGRVRFGFYNATVVLRHEHLGTLRDLAREAERVINDCGYGARLEAGNATDAFMATLPGHSDENVRRPPAHTANLSDTMPTSGVWTGEPTCPSPLFPPGSPPLMHGSTDGGIVCRINIHKHDNGNFAWFGPPGVGKTSLLNLTANQFLRYKGAKVRSIGLKGGDLVSCAAAGGSWVEVAGDGGPAFAPFAKLETESDRLSAAAFVATCFGLQRNGKRPEPAQRTAIRDAVESLRLQPGLRSVTNFCLAVQDREVRDAMAFYRGGLFDALEDQVPETHWDAFDITHIYQAGDEILLPAVLCLLRRFERGVDGKPQLWLMDEVSVSIRTPIWRPRFRALLKLQRSRNVAFGLATQNLADMTDADLLSVFLENVPTRFCGANPAAQLGGSGDERGPADFYKAFGYGWRQREIIRYAEPKRDYYVTQGEDNRLVDFNLGPVALALCASTSEDDVVAARALLAETGPGERFRRRWLSRKGMDHASLA